MYFRTIFLSIILSSQFALASSYEMEVYVKRNSAQDIIWKSTQGIEAQMRRANPNYKSIQNNQAAMSKAILNYKGNKGWYLLRPGSRMQLRILKALSISAPEAVEKRKIATEKSKKEELVKIAPKSDLVTSDDFCKSEVMKNKRLENYIWELTGKKINCESSRARKISDGKGSQEYYYVAGVNCQLPDNTAISKDLKSFLRHRGHPGFSVKKDGAKTSIVGGTSTMRCSHYIDNSYLSGTSDQQCKDSFRSKSSARRMESVIEEVSGVRPKCELTPTSKVRLNATDYYYVGNVSCVISNSSKGNKKISVENLSSKLRRKGFSGFYATSDKHEIRVSAQSSTGRCNRAYAAKPTAKRALGSEGTKSAGVK